MGGGGGGARSENASELESCTADRFHRLEAKHAVNKARWTAADALEILQGSPRFESLPPRHTFVILVRQRDRQQLCGERKRQIRRPYKTDRAG